MSLLKQRISSPLEAGTSLLDTQHLPSHLTQALEYASKRLARKAVPMTLVMVRRDYQVPWSCATPTSSTASTPNTPEFWTATNSSPSLFAAPVTGIRQLVRRGTNASIASLSSVSTVSSSTASDSGYGSACSTSTSPTFPPPTEPVATPRRWPLTSGSSVPNTPSSVSTATSTAPSVSAACPSPVGVRLLHVHSLTPKEERTLRTTFAKAERKFGTKGLFPPAATAASCGLNGDLIRRSILQNEVLFSSEGLTLLGLDRLYTFKAALAAYARTTLPPSSLASPLVPGESRARIEDAVDELRRLVLANGGRPISKIDLHRSYDWIGVSASALGDVERMYRRAYGGWERAGAFEVPPEEAQKETNNPPVEPEERSRNILRIGTPPAKAPVLKLQTTFDKSLKRPRAIRPEIVQPRSAEFQGQARAKEDDVVELEIKIDGLGRADEGDEDEDLTARPPASGHPYWNNSLGSSIDAMLKRQESPTAEDGMLRLSVDSQRLGPLTPNGFDDISPITRGEWGFLFSGDGSMSRAKTAPVETC